jgi:hypothetical protein
MLPSDHTTTCNQGKYCKQCLHNPSSASAPAYVAVSISHLISSEMVNLVETPRGVGDFAAVWYWAAITVVNIEMVVDMAAKVVTAVKPRSRSNEGAA